MALPPSAPYPALVNVILFPFCLNSLCNDPNVVLLTPSNVRLRGGGNSNISAWNHLSGLLPESFGLYTWIWFPCFFGKTGSGGYSNAYLGIALILPVAFPLILTSFPQLTGVICPTGLHDLFFQKSLKWYPAKLSFCFLFIYLASPLLPSLSWRAALFLVSSRNIFSLEA